MKTFDLFRRTMRRFGTGLALALSALSAAACEDDLTIPDFNNPGLEDFQNNPTRSGVVTATTGLLIDARAGIAGAIGYVVQLDIIGRNAYNLDPSDPRNVTQMLGPDLSSSGRGAAHWTQRYRNLRNANIVLGALDDVADFSEEERQGIRGFANTIKALDYLQLINTRDDNGIVLDVDRPPTGPPGPIESKEAAFALIVQLLDDAAVQLESAGAVFAFPLGAGFAGFDTPETFLQVNRALKARVDVYMGNYAGALTSLSESFLDPDADLTLGAYHAFSSASGDLVNNLFNPSVLYVHPSFVDDAEAGDARVAAKVTQLAAPRTVQGVTSDLGWTIYNSPNDPVPIIRNEELILLRAEANIGLGQVGDAADDINVIRTRSGQLPARNDLNAGNILDELLRQKRYSLVMEGGHRWLDMRRYDRLADLPLDQPTHVVHARFPIPQAEQDAQQANTGS